MSNLIAMSRECLTGFSFTMFHENNFVSYGKGDYKATKDASISYSSVSSLLKNAPPVVSDVLTDMAMFVLLPLELGTNAVTLLLLSLVIIPYGVKNYLFKDNLDGVLAGGCATGVGVALLFLMAASPCASLFKAVTRCYASMTPNDDNKCEATIAKEEGDIKEHALSYIG